MLPKFDHDAMLKDYLNGLNQSELARKYGVTAHAIQKSLAKRTKLRPFIVWNKEKDDELKSLYLGGLGCYSLAKHFQFSETCIRKQCVRLGILNSSRQFTKIHEDAKTRTHRRRSHEFSKATVRLRFSLQDGVCEWCKEKIGEYFNAPGITYHHRLPITDGGGKNIDNCVLLHTACHIANYRVLHNNRKFSHMWQDPTFCVWCGRMRKIDSFHLCLKCRAQKSEKWEKIKIRKKELKMRMFLHTCGCGEGARVLYCPKCTLKIIEENPLLSTRKLAKILGITQPAVVNQKKKLVAAVGIEPT